MTLIDLIQRVSQEPLSATDAAVNNLFTSAYVNGDCGLSDFARRVFEAFDEGEYIHAGESAELDGEPRTKSMLAAIFSRTA